MKKFYLLVLSIVLCFLCVKPITLEAYSNTTVSSSGNSMVVEGNNIVITFLVSSDVAKSGGIDVTCSSSLSIVDGKCLVTDTLLSAFDKQTNKGTFAFNTPRKLSGNYFQITLKANKIDKDAWVKATIQLKNGSEDLPGGSTTKKISIICKNHNYSDWTETKPTCTQNGSKSRTCSTCGYVDKVSIAALGHDLTNLTVTKEATCTEHGQASGICSRCNQSVTVSTDPKGHDWGSYKVITAATCTQQGNESRTCKVCGVKEDRITDFAKHQLDENEMSIEKEPTLTSCGIASGTCKVCNQTVRTEIPCSHTDEKTNANISCDEGVFATGTVIEIEVNNQEIVDSLSESNFSYTVLSVKALLNGQEVQPNGSLTVTLPIPEGYSNNVGLVYIASDGHIETIESKREGNNLVAKLNHFSNYAIVDYQVKVVQQNNIFMYTTIGLAITTILFAVLALKKKEKK